MNQGDLLPHTILGSAIDTLNHKKELSKRATQSRSSNVPVVDGAHPRVAWGSAESFDSNTKWATFHVTHHHHHTCAVVSRPRILPLYMCL